MYLHIYIYIYTHIHTLQPVPEQNRASCKETDKRQRGGQHHMPLCSKIASWMCGHDVDVDAIRTRILYTYLPAMPRRVERGCCDTILVPRHSGAPLGLRLHRHERLRHGGLSNSKHYYYY